MCSFNRCQSRILKKGGLQVSLNIWTDACISIYHICSSIKEGGWNYPKPTYVLYSLSSDFSNAIL